MDQKQEKCQTSPTVQIGKNQPKDGCITSSYTYNKNDITVTNSGEKEIITVKPSTQTYEFKTKTTVQKTGVMMVGWGGNNGSTLTACLLANSASLKWDTKDGTMDSNYLGSISQVGTVRLGCTDDGKEVYVPLKSLLPVVNPNELVVGGWDINDANLAESMKRAQVLHIDLQQKLVQQMKEMKPLPGIYYPEYIAVNQNSRANHCLPSSNRHQDNLDQIRSDIRKFKTENNLESVIVVWTANTECCVDSTHDIYQTEKSILDAIANNTPGVSPSQIFAVAAILEKCPYLNGSPQNTFVPGVVRLALTHKVFIGGNDFKSGQTKLKSTLVDFLISAGIKPESIVSYNHLGNNDGCNLSEQKQFKSKQLSKSNVIDDLVGSNQILFPGKNKPDHTVVIKYVPFVKDSKRALDEYISTICMNGRNTMSIYNVCEDSLLATPLIIDMIVFVELFQRVTYKTCGMQQYESFDPILSVLSYFFKAPVTRKGCPVINSLVKQRRCITNILLALLGLHPENDMLLEHKIQCVNPSQKCKPSKKRKYDQRGI
jgi:myo-inositol-1-phosphate synthase